MQHELRPIAPRCVLRWERVFDVNYLFTSIYVVYLYCYSSKDMHSRYAPPL